MFRKNSAKKVLKIIISKRLFLASVIFGLFLYSDFASAQTYDSLVQIPGMPANPNALKYLSGLYTFLISVVGIVAMGAIVIGGARYLTSVGNPSAIGDAKNTINSAIIGLLLALASWVIIGEINPDILVLKQPDVSMVSGVYDYGVTPLRCALPTGAGTAEAPCICLDGEEVEVVNPVPPYVISNLPAPCAENVSTAAPAAAIVITYSEEMDKVSVENPTAVVITASPAFNNINTTRVLGVTGRILTITPDPALPLTASTSHLVTVVGGNPALNKNIAGIPMISDYEFSFVTTTTFVALGLTCTPQLASSGSLCSRVCGDTNLAADGQYHCGWDFLVIRANIDGETLETSSSGDTYYILDTDKSQLWDMFLTNKGGWGAFDVDSTSYDDSKGYHYECAILVTARRVTNLLGLAVTGDYRNIFWVLPNTIIHKDGFSLEKDLCDKYAQCCNQPASLTPSKPPCDLEKGIKPGCDWSHDSTCALSTFLAGTWDIPLRYKGASRLFGAKYLSGIVNERCGDENPGTDDERSCLQALSRTEYRPGGDLLCSPVNGKWVPY